MFEETHIGEHRHHVPDPERVRQAHSMMTAGDFASQIPHRSYFQSEGEGCYLCALLVEIDRLRALNAEFLKACWSVIGRFEGTDEDRFGRFLRPIMVKATPTELKPEISPPSDGETPRRFRYRMKPVQMHQLWYFGCYFPDMSCWRTELGSHGLGRPHPDFFEVEWIDSVADLEDPKASTDTAE